MPALSLRRRAVLALAPLLRRLLVVLAFEPTWFPEFMSGVGMILWSFFCFLTDDIAILGWAWAVPVIGLFLLGPARVRLLFRLRYPPRVLAAFLGASWWGYLYIASCHTTGIIPQQGMMLALGIGDVLTLARFSIPCLGRRAEAP